MDRILLHGTDALFMPLSPARDELHAASSATAGPVDTAGLVGVVAERDISLFYISLIAICSVQTLQPGLFPCDMRHVDYTELAPAVKKY